ncbi:hypothetical protein ACIA8H_07310 [Streptomyces goshikiensis]|uniref:hypothetical protein n=1 Tax=Streptomyces goshikiensis TaxID=1942 RepID=UPI0037AD7033
MSLDLADGSGGTGGVTPSLAPPNDQISDGETATEYRELTDEESAAATARHQMLIGRVAQSSAIVELHLRQLMTGLLDSKYAGLVAAGLGMNDLIETSLALVKANEEITEAQRAEIRGLLLRLKPAVVIRNHLVHGLWVPYGGVRAEGDDAPLALISKRRTGDKAIAVSYEAAEDVDRELGEVGRAIFEWTFKVLRKQARRRQVYPPSI